MNNAHTQASRQICKHLRAYPFQHVAEEHGVSLTAPHPEASVLAR